MKDWIQDNYIMEDLTNYNTLRRAVTKAWNAIGWNLLNDLIDSMPERCEAVIAANGEATEY